MTSTNTRKTPLRTLLSVLALAAMSATAVHAQTVPTPPEQPLSQQPAPEGQMSVPMQDRGVSGDLAIDEAARQRGLEREAARMARQRERGPEGELSYPFQDRGGLRGAGEPLTPSAYGSPQ